MEALKAFSLALIFFSLAFSRLNCSISFSISRTGRQFSIDNNNRHRGSDEGDSPLLGELEGAAGEGEVVIGGEQRDQAKDEASEGLGDAEAIEGEPGAR